MAFSRIRTFFLLIALIVLIVIFFNVFQRLPFLNRGFISSEKIIVIDSGHGGKDSGTISVNNHYEKDINLEIGKKLYKKLKSMGYKVILTRETDEFLDNNHRADIANENKAEIFISIHGNAMENNNNINGIQVLYYPNREGTNSTLAQMILDEMVKDTGALDKGIVDREDLIVLNQTKMPAIIIEYGFLSNEDEEKLLLTNSYQNKVVGSIAEGLKKYFSLNS
ncbi:N-acetylmuramoyl-L-alanine amidase [Tissierella sp. MB52-C2]|uniref:N-acetylmuramoyl-L-alanine amidase family protein n=1 Tax=Tissierella sp. MB52-C2 TaxID=3070999 RepID=UPI00280A9EA6|nr:N-acetylmuramoyl-L-alanine amidase [Tissierella sp. MB52-C2]WMM26440.1 N-acetylmuramoyl-L-alanine amidase [Tissierella sp. MB52-C2]